MKKVLYIILGLILSTTFGASVYAQDFYTASFEGEAIKNFEVTIGVNKDTSINVEEKILYSTGGMEKHGIYRDIYLNSAQGEKMRITDLSVLDESGNPHPFEEKKEWDYLKLKIGDPDVVFSGDRTYIIKYRATNAVSILEGKDEIYWNATGNGWPFPILVSDVRVNLPSGVHTNSHACYAGYAGEQNPCTIFSSNDYYDFKSPTSLDAYQGITVAVGFDKGFITGPSSWEKFLEIFVIYGPWLIPIFVFIYLFINWYRHGRDPKKKGAIVPQYDAPEGFDPYTLGILIGDTRASSRSLSAQILDLAVKGYIKITYIVEDRIFIDKKDYVLTLIKKPENLDSVSSVLIDKLFSGASEGAEVKLSSLKNKFYKEISDLVLLGNKILMERGFFLGDPGKITLRYVVIGFVIIFTGIFSSMLHILSPGIFFVSGMIVVLFGSIMPKVTMKGAEVIHYAKGLKMYLDIAEKDRINFHNAPQKKPELFEKLLPYAMLFGLEKAWAKEFEDIYTAPPSWYSGPMGTHFSSVAFADSLSQFSSSTASTLYSSPGGSGGGGFSGGGGGGGGGGSW